MKRNRMVVAAALAVFAVTAAIALKANDDQSSNPAQFKFQPNSLVLSRSVYAGVQTRLRPARRCRRECVAGNVAVPLTAGGSNQVAVTCGAGFLSAPNQLDVSNSNTPGAVDPTNAVRSNYYRSVAEVDANGQITVTDGNADSGNNGRAAFKSARKQLQWLGTLYDAAHGASQ